MKNFTRTLILTISVLLAGCFLRPHQVDIQQGNTLSPTAIQQLHLNMKKSEVQELLGTPLLLNTFDDNSWTYAYTNQVNGGKIVKKSVVLYFSNNRVSKIEQH